METIVEHQNDADPTREGWKLSNPQLRVRGGVETVRERRFAYWSINDTGNEDGCYTRSLVRTQEERLWPVAMIAQTRAQLTRPWRMTMVARVVDVTATGTGFGLVLLDGSTHWRVSLTKEGAFYDSHARKPARYGKRLDTTDTYHQYELVLEPRTPGVPSRADQVTLFVDDVEHARLVRGDFRRTALCHGISFGSTNSAAKGEVRYRLVRFEMEDLPVATPEAVQPNLPQPHPSIVQKRSDRAWQIGSSKQLFIDRRFVETSENIELTVNPPVKHPEPVLRSDRPWDAFRLIFFSIAEDKGIYKMWYQAYDNDQWAREPSQDGKPGRPLGTPRMCYATSKDGLTWDKPSLGLVDYQGSKDNNILLEGSSKLAYVFIDPHGPAEQRYKMLSGIGTTRMRTSPDGVHWTLHPQVVWEPRWDTQKQAWWDARIGKYVVQTRVQIEEPNLLPFPFVAPIPSDPPVVAPKLYRPRRALGRVEMDDIMSPWPTDRVRTVMAADELDPPRSDIYHPGGVYQYPYAADAYFMFPLTYQHFRHGEGHAQNDGVNDCQFAASRDGIHWMRYDRKPFIPRGVPGAPDHGMTHGTGYFVRKGSSLYQYYGGWPWTHGGFRSLSPAERQDRKNWGRQFVGVVEHRLDGFVSADAPYTGGWLVTPPVVFQGRQLVLNIDVAAMGGARVEIQNAKGQPMPGFVMDDCDRILMNDVAYVVRWQGDTDVSSLAGQPIRLKFEMRSAKLYAFQFVSRVAR